MYNECILSEHKGNPLIEALPPLVDDETILRRLRNTQDCNMEERKLPAFVRKKILHRMEQFAEPTYQYLECYRKIEDLVVQSYIPKNPMTNTGQYWLHHEEPEKAKIIPSHGAFVSRATAMSVIGDGGSGKTWMIDSCLRALGPQVISHSSYKGTPLKITQVVWLKVICTENVNVGALLVLILEQLDALTGTDEARHLKPRNLVADASYKITKKLKELYCGVLIIDEIQHLSLVNETLRNLFVQFLFNTLARAGVPIVFVGDNRIVDFLSSSLPVARRAESISAIFMTGFQGDEWKFFAEELWKYQWTSTETLFSEEISDCLWELSTGLPDYAVKIYKAAQDLVIDEDDETISPAVLRQAYGISCMLSHHRLEERRGQLKGKQNSDSNVEVNKARKQSNPGSKPKKSKTIFDVNRVQHDEFFSRITALKENGFMLSVSEELDTLRKANDSPDPMKSLKASKILLRDCSLFVN